MLKRTTMRAPEVLGGLISCLVIALSLLVTQCVKIAETGESKFLLTSVGQENQLGTEGYKEVLGKAKISKDKRLNAMLVRVGQRIAAQTRAKGYKWEFTLIESEEQNAWCMPGGKVAFYTGILPALQNEAGMAVVMGHEVAHATLRHSGQRITQQMTAGTIGELVSTGLTGSKYHDATMAALGLGANVGVILPFSRKHESEADIIGLKYMAKAGYDPAEAVRFWQRFGRGGGSSLEKYLSTHPSGNKRVGDLQANLAEAKRLYSGAVKKHGVGERI